MSLLTERALQARRRSRVVAGIGGTLASALLLLAAEARPLASDKGAHASEYDLKAVFLYQFARFVDWPVEAFGAADAPLTIGVLGVDPFGRSLDEIVANEAVGGRKLAVRRYHNVAETDACQILFISDSEAERLDRVLATLKGRSILTVGDIERVREPLGNDRVPARAGIGCDSASISRPRTRRISRSARSCCARPRSSRRRGRAMMAPRTSIRDKFVTAIMLTSLTVVLLTGGTLIAHEVDDRAHVDGAGPETRADILAANSTAALAFQNPDDARFRDGGARGRPQRCCAAALYDHTGRLFATYFPEWQAGRRSPDLVRRGPPVRAEPARRPPAGRSNMERCSAPSI